MSKKDFALGFRRFAIVFVISLVFVGGLSELSYLILKEDYDRPAQDITLVIPSGTADKVATGEDSPDIPDEMVFISGDVLIVKNEDDVAHQLGPVWVPAGSSASLEMKDEATYDYSCSFKPSQYLGVDIREGTTLQIRAIALGYVTPATAIFIFVYSLVIFPLKNEEIPEAVSAA